ncbi:conserved oligomeric Golgi complex subunit 6-like [Macrosteles quadrilineatus]|uniref:conserved oligomeric Golgi complex subunit 6-like n=1 Tax=Macrosteles quadrilineatus TaxID=74068 RepID=UPI0023E339EF|nr:conserved oligomeric Golgi complex subunit 6-like [Macrosteles quadrilineatus]
MSVNSESVDGDEKVPKANVINSRLNKLFDSRFENDKETLDALKELSVFFTENTMQTRRSLRSKIEKRSLSINEDFLSAFRKVKEALDNIYLDVTDMNKAVETMTAQLQATKAQTHQLIEHTTKLQAEGQKLTMQQEVAQSFLKSFQLTPAELSALREANITEEFFAALDRVQTIHANCRTLMQSGHQTSALDIMDQMAMYQETALERLYRWAQTHCRNIEAPGINQLLNQAMAKLQDRPVLFKYVLTEYCTCRRAVLVHLFIDALTKGGPGGTPKPIEAHAHDAKRYVGDMLAWLHQAIPGERDNLLTLLKNCDTKTDVSEEVQQALSNISEGVCHPLQVRVDQILATDTSVVSLYHVSNLLRFYLQTFNQVVPGSSLEATLSELHSNSEKAFLSTLQSQVKQQLLEKVDAPPPDLSPSPGIPPLLTLLKEIISIASVAEGRQDDINKVVSCVMDPLLQAITLSASRLAATVMTVYFILAHFQVVSCVMDPLLQAITLSASRLAATDMAVYLLNCLHLMTTTLALYEFMDERLERLKAQSDAQLDTLTSEQASSLVANLNLGPIYTILQEQGKGPLSQVPGMEPANLNNFLGKLESLLNVPDMFSLPQMECLLSNAHRSVVQRRATQVITAIYTQLYNAVHNPDNLYANPSQLMSRTPEQVTAALLGS